MSSQHAAIIKVTACGLVMAWNWIDVLGTEARNQQRKATTVLLPAATPPTPSCSGPGKPAAQRDAPTMANALGAFPMALCFSAGAPKVGEATLPMQPWLLQNLGDLPCWAPEEIFITMTLNLVRFFVPGQMSVDFCYVFLPEIFSDKSSKHLMETQENAVLSEACLLGKYFECQILPNSEKVSFLPFFDKECS